ncbi:MAG: hypothetical protein GY805_14535 [Chloroflexi bacterium]|nr:hypothetical protein [Chloroflexota bacterium]
MLNRLQGVFASFQNHSVKYVIIGGIAAILHGVPRATFDLDILIEATPKNGQQLLNALLEAGLGTAMLTTVDDLLSHEITIFRDKIRIDVQTEAPGILFQDAWDKRQIMDYEGQTFFVVSRNDLITSKLAAGRVVDLEDVRMLRFRNEDEPGQADE